MAKFKVGDWILHEEGFDWRVILGVGEVMYFLKYSDGRENVTPIEIVDKQYGLSDKITILGRLV